MLRNMGAHTSVASRSGGRQMQVRAGFGGIGGQTGASALTAISKPTQVKITDGLIDPNAQQQVREMCRDMYFHDPIAGSTVDLYSNLPFGDFSLSGVPDKEQLEKFHMSCDRMRIKSFLPVMSNDYLVDGAFLGALDYDSSDKIFEAIIPHDLDMADLTFMPTFGKTPIVDLRFDSTLKKLLVSPNPHVKKAASKLPAFMIKGILTGKISLNPQNTLYIPRRTKTNQQAGVSFYQRVIPLWIYEKALLRGTIEMAHRRQRAILHGMAGGDDWEPTNEELATMAQQFMNADQDPLGATIFTRQDIMIQEIQPGGEFWKYSEDGEFIMAMKLRAFGISESFLSGEASTANADSSLTVFIQNIREYRNYITRVLFYEKLFPYIAVDNDFRKEEGHSVFGSMSEYDYEMGHSNGKRIFQENGQWMAVCDDREMEEIDGKDIKNFHIPTLTWHNQLRPEGDQEYMERLQQMQQMGIPIPIRMIAAAAGIDIGDIIYGMDEDMDIRKVLAKYRDDIKALMPDMSEEDQNQVNAAFEEASKILQGNRPGIRNLIDRKYDKEFYGPRNEINGTRYIMTPRERKRREDQASRSASIALAEIARRENAKHGSSETVKPI